MHFHFSLASTRQKQSCKEHCVSMEIHFILLLYSKCYLCMCDIETCTGANALVIIAFYLLFRYIQITTIQNTHMYIDIVNVSHINFVLTCISITSLVHRVCVNVI